MGGNANTVLAELTALLSRENVESPVSIAKLILTDRTGYSNAELIVDDVYITQEQYIEVKRVANAVAFDRVPVQYALNQASFRYLDLCVDERVLIPRPESEMIVDIAKFYLQENNIERPLIADIGTGSGALAISFAHEIEDCEVVASDISSEALQVARANAEYYSLLDKITFLECDCLSSFEYFQHSRNHFDCIVSNPPYIPTKVYEKLDSLVIDNEPRIALDGGLDGLDIFRKILEQCRWMIEDGGLFVFELYETCLDLASELARSAGLKRVSVMKDLAGKDRFLVAVG